MSQLQPTMVFSILDTKDRENNMILFKELLQSKSVSPDCTFKWLIRESWYTGLITVSWVVHKKCYHYRFAMMLSDNEYTWQKVSDAEIEHFISQGSYKHITKNSIEQAGPSFDTNDNPDIRKIQEHTMDMSGTTRSKPSIEEIPLQKSQFEGSQTGECRQHFRTGEEKIEKVIKQSIS